MEAVKRTGLISDYCEFDGDPLAEAKIRDAVAETLARLWQGQGGCQPENQSPKTDNSRSFCDGACTEALRYTRTNQPRLCTLLVQVEDIAPGDS
jgi:hypothetical protein